MSRINVRIYNNSLNGWSLDVSWLIVSWGSGKVYTRETGKSVNKQFKKREGAKLSYLQSAAVKCHEFIQRKTVFKKTATAEGAVEMKRSK